MGSWFPCLDLVGRRVRVRVIVALSGGIPWLKIPYSEGYTISFSFLFTFLLYAITFSSLKFALCSR